MLRDLVLMNFPKLEIRILCGLDGVCQVQNPVSKGTKYELFCIELALIL